MRTGNSFGRLLAAVGFALSLGGCLSAGQGSSPGAVGGIAATTPPPPPVTREAANGRRVVVATYNVGFSRETVRGVARGTASAQSKTKLEGVPDHVFQRIADAGHQDLVTRLRAAGFEVVPPTQSATYNGLSGGQNPRYAHDAANSRGVISFNMQQMQINSASDLKAVTAAGDPGALAFGGLDFNSGGRIAGELNAERVLTVRHVVDYVSQSSSNDMPLGSLTGRASVTTEQGICARDRALISTSGKQTRCAWAPEPMRCSSRARVRRSPSQAPRMPRLQDNPPPTVPAWQARSSQAACRA